MVNENKRSFLEKGLIASLRQLDPSFQPRWGKMNAQQMVEHLSSFFKMAADKLYIPLVTPEELLPKYMNFLMSEKEFRENTKAPFLPEEPLALQFPTMNEAVDDLEQQIKAFFDFFSQFPEKKTLHPAYGNLNFEEWIQIHYKHVKHHLKQFGIEIPAVNASV